MYTKTALIPALAGLSAAAPTYQPTGPVPNPNNFAVIALHSGAQGVHQRGVAANGQNFYLNKGTGTYCPSPHIDCSAYNSTTTVLSYNTASQTLYMDDSVPGGQQAYVRTDGSLGFTQAHSGSIPAGALLSPFQYTQQSSGGTVGTLKFQDQDFSACPDGTVGEDGVQVYKLFASAVAAEGRNEECVGVGFGTAIWSGATPWQYV